MPQQLDSFSKIMAAVYIVIRPAYTLPVTIPWNDIIAVRGRLPVIELLQTNLALCIAKHGLAEIFKAGGNRRQLDLSAFYLLLNQDEQFLLKHGRGMQIIRKMMQKISQLAPFSAIEQVKIYHRTLLQADMLLHVLHDVRHPLFSFPFLYFTYIAKFQRHIVSLSRYALYPAIRAFLIPQQKCIMTLHLNPQSILRHFRRNAYRKFYPFLDTEAMLVRIIFK
ncbi:hypothetical protein D3C78_953040 [compost metagenome]